MVDFTYYRAIGIIEGRDNSERMFSLVEIVWLEGVGKAGSESI